MNKIEPYISSEAKAIHRKAIKTIKLFRKNREEFVSLLTNENWISWAQSPMFWLQWVLTNVESTELLDYIVQHVLKFDKTNKWFDLKDTIAAVYIEPDRWLDPELSLESMIKKNGMPE